MQNFKGEIGRFHVFPKKDKWYFTILVFRDRGYMRRAYQGDEISGGRTAKERMDTGFDAIVCPMATIDVKGKMLNSMGYVLFPQNRLTMEVIAHESLHMAIAYLRFANKFKMPKKTDAGDEEEKIAELVGECAKQVNNNLYAMNLYK